MVKQPVLDRLMERPINHARLDSADNMDYHNMQYHLFLLLCVEHWVTNSSFQTANRAVPHCLLVSHIPF